MTTPFDEHQASFVSVTQALNTTTSMGRLTLNVLLSFAQFEREVTGERIRGRCHAELGLRSDPWPNNRADEENQLQLVTGDSPKREFRNDHERNFPMLKIEVISANAVKITVPAKLKADDFLQIAPQIDLLVSQQGQIRLLIDASGFTGWENIAAFENHAGFIKSHQQRVERIAVIAAHEWQHWLIGAVRMFVHPKVKAYEKSHEGEALQWIVE